ncbi:MAG: exodeoxyribonuclease VII large subunit [Glaciecola sp.]|jgi:exodeoxyribonuclease VII large subunit
MSGVTLSHPQGLDRVLSSSLTLALGEVDPGWWDGYCVFMSLFDLPSNSPDPRKKVPGTERPSAQEAEVSQPAGPEILGVAELTGRIAGSLNRLGRLSVEGEVGAPKRAGSGHVYFTLKDSKASLACAIWRSRVASGLRFPLEEGQQVVVHGKLDVYAPRGSYSLIVERVERRGMGELLANLERLKQELHQRGWFDRARPLPVRPRCVGLVTSRDADALRDFLRTRSLRWPGYPMRFVHTRVQGPGAAQEIADAIRRLDDGNVDVICVVRGGGSLEDLWAFNELPVAQAVWNCSVPVVSGVGHETDTTLIDHVSDHRAHTPTNAAESAIPDRGVLLDRLERAGAYMETAIQRHLRQRVENLDRLAARPSLASADGFLHGPLQALNRLNARLQRGAIAHGQEAAKRLERLATGLERQSPTARLSALEARLQAQAPRLRRAMQVALDRRESQLKELERCLAAISPLGVLERGYAIVQTATGVVRDGSCLEEGQQVQITFARGQAAARIEGSTGAAEAAGDAEESQ